MISIEVTWNGCVKQKGSKHKFEQGSKQIRAEANIWNMQDCHLQSEAFQELLRAYILSHPLVVIQAVHLSFSRPEPCWRLLWTPQLRSGHWHPIHQTLAMVYPFPVDIKNSYDLYD